MSFVPVLVIHGGAGTITKGECDDKIYRDALRSILEACSPMLVDGTSTALDIATRAVVLLEDNPLFNAGYGSVFNHAGEHECDAAVAFAENVPAAQASLRRDPEAEGYTRDLSKGAAGVGGVRTIRNPILGARSVLENSPVALLIGRAADSFVSKSHVGSYASLTSDGRGIAIVENSYFSTQRRADQLHAIKRQLGENVMTLGGEFVATGASAAPVPSEQETKRGTVGAVVVDAWGNVAAATSTGGLTNKTVGRVGDTATIGHGTIADQREGIAVSCTGTGEAFMRSCAAHELVSYVRHARVPRPLPDSGDVRGAEEGLFKEAAIQTIFNEVPIWGGDGGLIAVKRIRRGDHDESPASPAMLTCFNTKGMYRGFVTPSQTCPSSMELEVAVFGRDECDLTRIDVFEGNKE